MRVGTPTRTILYCLNLLCSTEFAVHSEGSKRVDAWRWGKAQPCGTGTSIRGQEDGVCPCRNIWPHACCTMSTNLPQLVAVSVF